MRLNRNLLILWAGLLASAFLLGGCATSRSEIGIGVSAVQTVDTGHYAKITGVRDLRRFEVNPSNPAKESLGNAGEIGNPAITGRAIARKRNSFGQALGDVMLPEGQSVAGLVADAARKALVEKGYTVVDERSPRYATAATLALDVEHFWAWFRPGFWAIELKSESDVVMKGDVLIGGSPQTAHGEAQMSAQAAFDSTWQQIIQKGVDDLVEKMKARLRSPGN